MSEPSDKPQWQAEAAELLEKAASLCIDHGVDLEAFMRGAWAFYVEARPGMRDYLEEVQLRNQIEELRAAGRVGEA